MRVFAELWARLQVLDGPHNLPSNYNKSVVFIFTVQHLYVGPEKKLKEFSEPFGRDVRLMYKEDGTRWMSGRMDGCTGILL